MVTMDPSASNSMDKAILTGGQAAMMFLFWVILPFANVLSDWWLMGKLIFHTISMAPKCTSYTDRTKSWTDCQYGWDAYRDVTPEDMTFYSIMLLLFPCLSMVFVTYHWYTMEEGGWRSRMKTLPLAVLQVYPQYKALQMIYHGVIQKSNGKWQKMKKQPVQELVTVQALVKSLPQVFVLTSMGARSFDIGPNIFFGFAAGNDPVTWFAFVTSILTALMGLFNFIVLGLMNICGAFEFAFAPIIILISLAGRVVTLSLFMSGGSGLILEVIVLLFLPKLLLQTVILLLQLGPKRTLVLVSRYPGVIVVPLFTPLTFGPPPPYTSCMWNCRDQGTRLQWNIACTAVNAVLTFGCEIGCWDIIRPNGFSLPYIMTTSYTLTTASGTLVLTLILLLTLKCMGTKMNQPRILDDTTDLSQDTTRDIETANTEGQLASNDVSASCANSVNKPDKLQSEGQYAPGRDIRQWQTEPMQIRENLIKL